MKEQLTNTSHHASARARHGRASLRSRLEHQYSLPPRLSRVHSSHDTSPVMAHASSVPRSRYNPVLHSHEFDLTDRTGLSSLYSVRIRSASEVIVAVASTFVHRQEHSTSKSRHVYSSQPVPDITKRSLKRFKPSSQVGRLLPTHGIMSRWGSCRRWAAPGPCLSGRPQTTLPSRTTPTPTAWSE